MNLKWQELSIILSVFLLLTACTGGAQTASTGKDRKENGADTIHIGYQKFGTLNILKAENTLEGALEAIGVNVEWTEFPAGPQLLEAVNGGSIDFGHTGEAPPIFSQAAGAPIVYVGNGPPRPKSEAIVVQENSPIEHVHELKGKKVVLNRGSNVHYLLVKALEEAGLSINEDIETIYLPPAEARTAFERGDVDAWVIWDPFLQAAEDDIGARIIRDAEGLAANREFLLADRAFAEENPEIIDIVLKELEKVEQNIKTNIEETAQFLSPQVGIDEETLKKVLTRYEFGMDPIDEEVLEAQQSIANTFYNLGLIPEEVSIKKATLEEGE